LAQLADLQFQLIPLLPHASVNRLSAKSTKLLLPFLPRSQLILELVCLHNPLCSLVHEISRSVCVVCFTYSLVLNFGSNAGLEDAYACALLWTAVGYLSLDAWAVE